MIKRKKMSYTHNPESILRKYTFERAIASGQIKCANEFTLNV